MVVADGTERHLIVEPAGFGSRLAAYLLDSLVAFIISCLCAASAGLLLLINSDMGRKDPSERAIYAALIVASLAAPIWLVMTLHGWTAHGRTIGKLAMNLRIVDGRGRNPSLARALPRMVVYLLESLPLAGVAPVAALAYLLQTPVVPRVLVATGLALLVPLISVALALGHPRRRALHDIVAGTLVVRD